MIHVQRLGKTPFHQGRAQGRFVLFRLGMTLDAVSIQTARITE